MKHLPVLVEVQKELLQLLLKDEALATRFDNLKQEKTAQQNDENHQFVGFILRNKAGTKSNYDIGFTLKKFENMACSNLADPSKNPPNLYISTYEYNKEKDVVSVTLRRENVLKTLQQQRWRNSYGENDIHNVKHIFKCHLTQKTDSVANIRTLLYSFFIKRFLTRMCKEDIDIFCEIRNSDDVTCEKESLILKDEDIDIIQHELSLKNLTFEKINDSSSEQCEIEVENIKRNVDVFLMKGVTVFDGKKYVENILLNSGYTKDISLIALKNTDSTWSSCFKDAVEMKDMDQSKSVVHFVVIQKINSVQKSSLVYQVLTKNHKQKFCSFEEQPSSLMNGHLEKRKDELFASYRSKYGRVVTGEQWEDTIKQVAVSSLILDVFSLSLNNKLKIASVKDVSCLSSRKSLFILYNYARINQLLEQYDEKVSDGVYEALPDIENIDFSLLSEDAEWQIVLQYILYYPNLMYQLHCHLTQSDSHRLHVPINLLCQFLSDLCHDFSSYYHQTKVLLDPLPHLFQLINARLYFVKNIKEMMSHCFQLLGVTPPHQM